MTAPIIYCWDETTKLYSYKMESQIDPLESEKAGHEVYMGLPKNGTYSQPLQKKENYDVVWGGEHWQYKKQEKADKTKPHQPTELEQAYQELFKTQQWLNDHDYIGTKIATGRATIEDYKEEIALMNQYASKVVELKEKIKQLEEQ